MKMTMIRLMRFSTFSTSVSKICNKPQKAAELSSAVFLHGWASYEKSGKSAFFQKKRFPAAQGKAAEQSCPERAAAPFFSKFRYPNPPDFVPIVYFEAGQGKLAAQICGKFEQGVIQWMKRLRMNRTVRGRRAGDGLLFCWQPSSAALWPSSRPGLPQAGAPGLLFPLRRAR